MFDKFTYRQKNYGLLVLFILLVMASYKRGFSLTLGAMYEIEQQEIQLKATENAQENIESLRIQIHQLNNNIGKSDIAPDKVNQKILSEISTYSFDHNVQLYQIEKTHQYQTVDFDIYSNLISVEGSFDGILGLVHEMEHKFQYARITNVQFIVDQDYRSKNKKLYGKILFQHYRQK